MIFLACYLTGVVATGLMAWLLDLLDEVPFNWSGLFLNIVMPLIWPLALAYGLVSVIVQKAEKRQRERKKKARANDIF